MLIQYRNTACLNAELHVVEWRVYLNKRHKSSSSMSIARLSDFDVQWLRVIEHLLVLSVNKARGLVVVWAVIAEVQAHVQVGRR